jgi:hypothetical protein
MTRQHIYALVLGVALVATIIAAVLVRFDAGHALIGFAVLFLAGALTMSLFLERPSPALLFADVLILGLYGFCAVRYVQTLGTLVGSGLGTLYGVLFYLGWLAGPGEGGRGATPGDAS